MDESNTYWNHNGKQQALADRLEERVPTAGEACEKVELFRLIANVYYDVYNNGGGNLVGFGSEFTARELIALADKQGVDMGYVEEKLEKAWERGEELDSQHSNGYITDDEHINECMDFCEDVKFLTELEGLVDTIILHCTSLVKGEA